MKKKREKYCDILSVARQEFEKKQKNNSSDKQKKDK